jgi:GNAT superfamily N-acetyltransferase
MSDLSFRIAEPCDVPQITALVNIAYRGDSSRQGWTTEADLLDGQRTDEQAVHAIISAADNCIVLCLQADEIIGTVHLRREQTTCHFGMFTVRPGLQGRGIGKRFIAYAEQFARDKWGCTTMSMTVIDLRQELLEWYRRRGYRQTGERADFPYGDERYGLPRRDDLRLTVLRKSLVE